MIFALAGLMVTAAENDTSADPAPHVINAVPTLFLNDPPATLLTAS